MKSFRIFRGILISWFMKKSNRITRLASKHLPREEVSWLDPKNIPSKHRENLRRYDWKPRVRKGSFFIPHPKKNIYLRSTPHPVTVTTRIITFLVGNPYKPSFATVTGWGVDPIYTQQTGLMGVTSIFSKKWIQEVSSWPVGVSGYEMLYFFGMLHTTQLYFGIFFISHEIRIPIWNK